ncbi:uncharacterized protein LOC118418060 [Branchiostoma floridae]|uniref:Uncharacterized protein LOC118418060 n=1 Tax=Branchiostoma floridae TaxID=7739 RepID=A0A9J7LCT6_BRAFL|nr:uncharacterized protein LOC118418060 [Branchiostoma floridae]
MAEGHGRLWGVEETRCLVGLWGELEVQKKFDNFRSKQAMEKIVRGMSEAGFERTLKQIQTKMRDMRYRYRKAKRDNQKSGAGPSTCPFYAELDKMLGDRPATLPHHIVQTNFSSSSASDTESGEEDGENEADTADDRPVTPPSDSVADSTGDENLSSSLLSNGNEEDNLSAETPRSKGKKNTPGGKVKYNSGGKGSASKDSAGKDSAGKDSAGKDSAGKDSAGKDSAGKDSTGKRKGTGFTKIERNKKKTRLDNQCEGLHKAMSAVQTEGFKQQEDMMKKRDQGWKDHDVHVTKMQQEADRDMMAGMMGQFMGMMGQFMAMFGQGAMPQRAPFQQAPGAMPQRPPFQQAPGAMPQQPPFQQAPFQQAPGQAPGGIPEHPPFQGSPRK